MAGKAPTQAAQQNRRSFPSRFTSRSGPLNIDYTGPPDFLDKLPGIIVELGKFETLLRPPAPSGTTQ